MMKAEKIKHNLTSIIKLTTFLSVPPSLTVPALVDHELKVWHDDMPSKLMVYDGIKALSGAHRRCLEPRP